MKQRSEKLRRIEREQGENNRSNTKKKKKRKTNPAPPVIGTVATRTRHQKKTQASRWNQPVPILVNMLSYADPELLRLLCCVSKQFHDIIYKNFFFVPLLCIRPSKIKNDIGRLNRLLQQLYFLRDKLQRYRAVKIIEEYTFLGAPTSNDCAEVERIRNILSLEGVVSLDLSSLSKTTTIAPKNRPLYFTDTLADILPNLREINLSNTVCCGYELERFSGWRCQLQKIIWNNISIDSEIRLDGFQMVSARHLQAIYMDNAVFLGGEIRLYSNLDSRSSQYCLFESCKRNLIRVSIQNARCRDIVSLETHVLPQNVLIKFVRQALPSFRWFRSDLSSKNITMLRAERPDIEFVN